jgi:2-hydroxychromene-2-carboxylate isomerase
MKKNNPRFFFSFRSPYSWITVRKLEEEYPEIQREIDYIPYWEPDNITYKLLKERGGEFLYVPMNKEKHLYILQDIKRLVVSLGYEMKWPVDINPWWELPHLAYLKAKIYGKQREFMLAVFSARWEYGLDICSNETISQIASGIGLDPTIIITAPYESNSRLEGTEMLFQAYKDAVFGVPFLINQNDKFWGVDRLPQFVNSFYQDHGKKNKNINWEINGQSQYDFDYCGGCG